MPNINVQHTAFDLCSALLNIRSALRNITQMPFICKYQQALRNNRKIVLNTCLSLIVDTRDTAIIRLRMPSIPHKRIGYTQTKKEEIRLISVKVTIKENNDTYYIRNLLYLRSEKLRNVQDKSIILTNKTRELLIKTDRKDHLL